MAESFLKTLRGLATCYQAFEAYSGTHVRGLGLTPAQFDVIATLGNTPGMSCRQLGEKTLITKGTLTGVLDRLEARGVIERTPSAEDRRSIFVKLTGKGEHLFDRVFPVHIAWLKTAFSVLDPNELTTLERLLSKLTARLAPDESEQAHAASSPKSRMIAAARSAA